MTPDARRCLIAGQTAQQSCPSYHDTRRQRWPGPAPKPQNMLSSHAALGLALLHVTVNLVLRTEQVRPTGKMCGGGGGEWGGGVVVVVRGGTEGGWGRPRD